MIDHIKVFLAGKFGIGNGKKMDVHGRTYQSVYKRWGHYFMLEEYRETNSWMIK